MKKKIIIVCIIAVIGCIIFFANFGHEIIIKRTKKDAILAQMIDNYKNNVVFEDGKRLVKDFNINDYIDKEKYKDSDFDQMLVGMSKAEKLNFISKLIKTEYLGSTLDTRKQKNNEHTIDKVASIDESIRFANNTIQKENEPYIQSNMPRTEEEWKAAFRYDNPEIPGNVKIKRVRNDPNEDQIIYEPCNSYTETADGIAKNLKQGEKQYFSTLEAAIEKSKEISKVYSEESGKLLIPLWEIVEVKATVVGNLSNLSKEQQDKMYAEAANKNKIYLIVKDMVVIDYHEMLEDICWPSRLTAGIGLALSSDSKMAQNFIETINNAIKNVEIKFSIPETIQYDEESKKTSWWLQEDMQYINNFVEQPITEPSSDEYIKNIVIEITKDMVEQVKSKDPKYNVNKVLITLNQMMKDPEFIKSLQEITLTPEMIDRLEELREIKENGETIDDRGKYPLNEDTKKFLDTWFEMNIGMDAFLGDTLAEWNEIFKGDINQLTDDKIKDKINHSDIRTSMFTPKLHPTVEKNENGKDVIKYVRYTDEQEIFLAACKLEKMFSSNEHYSSSNLPWNIATQLAQIGGSNNCCAGGVSMALYFSGLISREEFNEDYYIHRPETIWEKFAGGDRFPIIDGVENMQPGDIVFMMVNNTRHVQVYAGRDADGNYLWYNWGSRSSYGDNVSLEPVVSNNCLEAVSSILRPVDISDNPDPNYRSKTSLPVKIIEGYVPSGTGGGGSESDSENEEAPILPVPDPEKPDQITVTNAIIEKAKLIHDRQIDWKYNENIFDYNINIENQISNENKETNSIAYVGAVLFESEVIAKENFENFDYRKFYEFENYLKDKWEIIYDAVYLKQGDIGIFEDSKTQEKYMQIYVGDNQWYSSKDQESINTIEPIKDDNIFEYAVRPDKSLYAYPEIIINQAIKIHDLQNTWTYSDIGLKSSIRNQCNNKNKVTNDAAFVSRVLYETQLINESIFSKFKYYKVNELWEFLKDKYTNINDYNDLKQGDIVLLNDGRKNYIQIYYGNNQWISSKDNETIKGESIFENINEKNNFKSAIRLKNKK